MFDTWRSNQRLKILSKILKSLYFKKINEAKKALSMLPPEKAKIYIDYETLGMRLPKRDFFVNPNDEGISADLYAYKFREPVNTHMIYDFLSSEKDNIDVVIDIGSNIGYFAFLESLCGFSVIAVEPVPETVHVLKRNLGPHDKLLNVAVANRKGKERLYVPTKRNVATLIKDAATIEAPLEYIIDVPTVTVTGLIKEEMLETANVVLRMDIEGYEEEVLQGIPKSVYAILFELHPHILGVEMSKRLIRNLQSGGFSIEHLIIDPKGAAPLVNLFGLKLFIRLCEIKGSKRVYTNPTINEIDSVIQSPTVCPHIFAKRNE